MTATRNDDEWLTVREAAERTGSSKESLWQKVYYGRIETKREGRRLFVKLPPPKPPKPVLVPLDPALLDVPAVAQILGTTTSFVIDQSKSGRLPAQRRGRFWYVHRDDVAVFIEACRIAPRRPPQS